MKTFHPGQRLAFKYENYRGEVDMRHVIFLGLQYGDNEWYPEPQWFIRTHDLAKNAVRSFAFSKIDIDSLCVIV